MTEILGFGDDVELEEGCGGVSEAAHGFWGKYEQVRIFHQSVWWWWADEDCCHLWIAWVGFCGRPCCSLIQHGPYLLATWHSLSC